MDQADEFADLGITCIWLPPPTDSVSPQGYMPGDLYNLNSKYGSQEDLKRSVKSSVRKLRCAKQPANQMLFAESLALHPLACMYIIDNRCLSKH